jgi:hypothetical protein
MVHQNDVREGNLHALFGQTAPRLIQDLQVVRAEVALVQENGFHAGAPQHVSQVMRAAGWVDVHQNRANPAEDKKAPENHWP